ncbi:MAG: type II secretion system protein GspF [Desulfobacteraceae bacterium]|nr:MAG: type II secretion system protein GspF [Desulfobacteraceae bacterium]
MAVFEYRAFDKRARKISGMIDAETLNAAQNKLRQQEIFPISLTRVAPEKSTGANGFGALFNRILLFSSIKPAETAMFTRQLSTLLAAGFPLAGAVSTLASQTRRNALKRILSQLKDAIEEGNSFAEALALFPHVFSPVYINMVRAGESSGTLEVVLERLADFAEKRESNKKKIQAALAYPFIMAIIGFAVLLILLVYIVPKIIEIFTGMNQDLPLPTQILVNVSSFAQSYWWGVLPAPFLIMALVTLIRKTDQGGRLIDRFILFLPIFGPLLRKIIAARISRTLGSLLENGVPMLTALQITRTISGNRVISDLLASAALHVEQGGELGKTLSQSRAFPQLAGQMITVGETSGELENMLEKSAELFERDIETTISTAMSLVEPVIILIMGAVVLFIVLSIFLPILEINQLIR